jgi:superfamily I DNA/RNA helicase
MDQSNKVISDYQKAVDEFIQTLAKFTQEEINTVPFQGSWTAGQVARHIIKGIGGMPDLLMYGEVRVTERAPDANVKQLDDVFLNFEKKLKSPDFVLPENITYNKEELVNSLKDIKQKTVEAAKGKDFSLTSYAFEMPVMGFMTLYELLHFSQIHTIRHNRQLKNIHEKLAGKVAQPGY